MAKIHIDCEDAIAACEKALIEENEQFIAENKEKGLLEEENYGDLVGAMYRVQQLEQLHVAHHNQCAAIERLMHGVAYLAHKNRRLILDTQSNEFGLIANLLPKRYPIIERKLHKPY